VPASSGGDRRELVFIKQTRHAKPTPGRRRLQFLALSVAALILVSACGGAVTSPSGGGQASDAPSAPAPATPVATVIGGGDVKVTEWDYYAADPQQTAWGQLLASCAEKTGIAIDRQAFPRDELIQKVLLGAQQGQLPGILQVDNPDLQQIAETGALVPLTDFGVNTDGLYANIVDAGSYEGNVYGVAPGINGMALFYNRDLLEAAGVEPPTTWAEVKDAAAKLTKDDTYGIAFSAPGNEEGTWQFLPWFWGAGADLTKLDSPEAVQALQFWTDLVADGSASQSVVQWSQGDVNDQFMAGKAAMQQNGVWNLGALDENGINYGIVPLPNVDGGAAPGPMGGEVLTIPTTDEATQTAAGKVVNCLLEDDSMQQWAELQNYIPSRESLAQSIAAANPNMKAFVDAAAAERSRPGPPANLGPKYGQVSQALWTAIQSSLSGGKSAQDALTEAQTQASQ
jgi:multiple sugar transport system substrate-binding protein